MFLCDHANINLSVKDESTLAGWNQLKIEEKDFTWPDKPVLFDELENIFIEKSFDSQLMYFHKSPGLLRLKSKWQNTEKEVKNNNIQDTPPI